MHVQYLVKFKHGFVSYVCVLSFDGSDIINTTISAIKISMLVRPFNRVQSDLYLSSTDSVLSGKRYKGGKNLKYRVLFLPMVCSNSVGPPVPTPQRNATYPFNIQSCVRSSTRN